MRFQFLGTGGGLPTRERKVSGVIADGGDGGASMLLDAGDGTHGQLLASGFRVSKIDVILVTHAHGDHCYGLPGLVMSWHVQGRKRPLIVGGPAEVRKFLFDSLENTSISPCFEIDFRVIEERSGALELAGWVVESRRVYHRVEAYAYRIMRPGEGEGGLVYSGDNGDPGVLAGFARAGDVLIHEATYASGIPREILARTRHSTARMVGEFARDAGIDKLILDHISPRYRGEGVRELMEDVRAVYGGQGFIAEDMDIFLLESGQLYLSRDE